MDEINSNSMKQVLFLETEIQGRMGCKLMYQLGGGGGGGNCRIKRGHITRIGIFTVM